MDLKKTCAALYVVYLVDGGAGDAAGALIGSLLIIAGCGRYAKRDAAKETPLKAISAGLIRTFWIGGGVYIPVLTLIATGACTRSSITTSWPEDGRCRCRCGCLQLGRSGASAGGGEPVHGVLMQVYGPLMHQATLAVSAPFLLWWSRACGVVCRAQAGKPISTAESWI